MSQGLWPMPTPGSSQKPPAATAKRKRSRYVTRRGRYTGRALFARKGSWQNQGAYIQQGVNPIPLQAFLTLPYASEQTITIAGSVVTATKHSWRLNSCHDPDQSGGGHQPLWYDQFTPIYNNYLVLSCKWKITYMIDAGAYPGCPVWAVCNTVTDTNASTNGTIAGATSSICLERPEVKCKPLPYPGQGTGQCIIYGFTDIAKAFGIPREKLMGDANYSGTVGNNPTRVVYLETGAVCNGVGADSTMGVNIVAEFQYKVMMWGWQVPTQS